MTCINCGNSATENFCPNCGQRTNVKRITFKEGWNDFWARIYGFDGMFPRTLRDLTLQPGIVAKKYIEGNRTLYYGPVGYFFLMITVYLLLMSLLNVDIKDFMGHTQQMMTPIEPGAGQKQFLQILTDIISQNLKFIAFAIMPFHALSAKYFFFRRSKMNFMEHLIIPFYILGHVYIVSLFSVIVFKFTGSLILNSVAFIISLLYFGFAYSQAMSYQSRLRSFLKGVGVPLVGFLIMIVILYAVAIFSIWILQYINPEMFELIRPSNNR